MKTITKRILLISLCMMLAGGILTALGCAMGGFPGVSVSSRGIHSVNRHIEPYEQEKIKLEAFQDLQIRLDSAADIRILPSDDNSFYLEYLLDGEYSKPEYSVKDHTFTFTQKDDANGIINIGTIGIFISGSRTAPDNYCLTLYVPEKRSFGDVSIYDSYGDITVKDLICSSLKLTLESGDLTLHSADAAALTLSNEYGSTDIQDFSGNTADIHLESGHLTMAASEIETLTLDSEYGDVTIEDFSGDTANLELESGSLEFDAAKLTSLTGKNEYGDMLFLLPEKLDAYTIHAETEYGEILLPEDAPYSYYSSQDFEAVYRLEGSSDKSLTLTAESGNIQLKER